MIKSKIDQELERKLGMPVQQKRPDPDVQSVLRTDLFVRQRIPKQKTRDRSTNRRPKMFYTEMAAKKKARMRNNPPRIQDTYKFRQQHRRMKVNFKRQAIQSKYFKKGAGHKMKLSRAGNKHKIQSRLDKQLEVKFSDRKEDKIFIHSDTTFSTLKNSITKKKSVPNFNLYKGDRQRKNQQLSSLMQQEDHQIKNVMSTLKQQWNTEDYMQQLQDEECKMNEMLKDLYKQKEKRTSYYKLLEAHEEVQRDYLEQIQLDKKLEKKLAKLRLDHTFTYQKAENLQKQKENEKSCRLALEKLYHTHIQRQRIQDDQIENLHNEHHSIMTMVFRMMQSLPRIAERNERNGRLVQRIMTVTTLVIQQINERMKRLSNRGFTLTEIDRIPELQNGRTIKCPHDEMCTICQERYKENDYVKKLSCGHCYHSQCIKDWLLRKKVCPLCQQRVQIPRN